MRTPRDIALDHTVDFIRSAVPRGRILEVGCGDGSLALRLRSTGLELLAIDADPEAANRARDRGVQVLNVDFTGRDAMDAVAGIGLDAVLFTRSLHHIHEIDTAIQRSAELLEPGGLIVVEEFDLDHIDANTADWFYDRRSELLPDEELPGPPDAAPLARWVEEHAHEPALLSGGTMKAAIEQRFSLQTFERVPYLYRYVCRLLPDTATPEAHELFDDERRRIDQKSLLAVGLRLVGRKD